MKNFSLPPTSQPRRSPGSRPRPKTGLPARAGLAALALAGLGLAASCQRQEPARWQGYYEGEFVYVAAPLAGQLEQLHVSRGDRVQKGAPLFTLDRTTELAAQREAAQRLAQAGARLADLRKGQRPTELAALEARLGQSQAAEKLAALELERISRLYQTSVVSTDDFDRVRLNHERAAAQVAELASQLATARLGARSDAIAAAEAEVAAARAALERADWSVAQKTQAAPQDALVFDTLYRSGEFVAAAAPVVSLLPPENIFVRFFVPEAVVGTLQTGDVVHVAATGRAEPREARINYVAPKPEFTPPVLYNRENRAKIVFMIEARFPPAVARELHPGQPVDVRR